MRRIPDDRAAEREHWRTLRRERPARIEPAGPGDESVWDYPRPPRVEADARRVLVEVAGTRVADSTRALRVLETATPPCFYVPQADARVDLLEASPHTTFCEWKGVAAYWSLRLGEHHIADAAWSYPEPDPEYAELRDHLAFFPGRVDACSVGGVKVTPQPGGYYGGWVTPQIVGPFKGEPGTEGW